MANASPLNIKVITGTTRPNRFSEKAADWIFDILKTNGNVNSELLDLRDYPLPFYNEPITPSMFNGKYPSETVEKWAKKIEEADGYIIVTAEYNHGYPAVLKNALDYVYTPWNKKAVAFVAYGGVGGGRSVEQLREVCIELQMAPIRNAVHIPAQWHMLEQDGGLKAGSLDPFKPAAEGMLAQLLWWAGALKTARTSDTIK